VALTPVFATDAGKVARVADQACFLDLRRIGFRQLGT
jgi:hypothetical protein